MAAGVPGGRGRAAFLAWRGALKLWTGAYAEARQDLDLAAAADNPDALCWRGGARVMLGELPAALDDLDRLLAKDPHDPEGLVWRGEALRRQERFTESLRDLDAVIAQQGDQPWARVNRALIYLKSGEVASALSDFAELSPPPMDARQRPRKIAPSILEPSLQRLLVLGRGCRRADPHLNAGWMHAAGIPVKAPSPGVRFSSWLAAEGLSPVPAAHR